MGCLARPSETRAKDEKEEQLLCSCSGRKWPPQHRKQPKRRPSLIHTRFRLHGLQGEDVPPTVSLLPLRRSKQRESRSVAKSPFPSYLSAFSIHYPDYVDGLSQNEKEKNSRGVGGGGGPPTERRPSLEGLTDYDIIIIITVGDLQSSSASSYSTDRWGWVNRK